MKRLLLVITLIFTFTLSAKTQELFDGFWDNSKESFTENAPLHAAALGLTPILISTGIDARVHTAFNGSEHGFYLPGVSAGYLLPFISLPMYAEGRRRKDQRLVRASYAVAQTAIITLTTVSLLKSFSGRKPPDVESSRSVQRQSREFSFGFLNRGIYDGWPSGHMATITSIASSMIHYYPEQLWPKYVGGVSMAYILLMISAEDKGQFHWFSDGVAGGLIGWAIGRTVGTNMRASQEGIGAASDEPRHEFLPILDQRRKGLQVVWTY